MNWTTPGKLRIEPSKGGVGELIFERMFPHHPHPASPAPQGRFAEFGGGGCRRQTEGVKLRNRGSVDHFANTTGKSGGSGQLPCAGCVLSAGSVMNSR